jgi:hypothetical protein
MEKKELKKFLETKKVKTFDDLEFKPHELKGAVHAVMTFPNGHRISVVGGGRGLYGDGVNTFEIWRSCDGDVKGHLTKDDVTDQMLELQSMNKDVPKVGF